jgi:hypothetical protein
MSRIIPKLQLPWVSATAEERARLEAELSAEICLLHPLASVDRKVIARRVDSNDVLVEIQPHLCQCAQVRLTWSGRTEMNPEIPHTELQATFDDWIAERMVPDRAAYVAARR